jgi:hypothetical protein
MTSLTENEQVVFGCAKDPFFFGKVVAPQYFFKGFASFHRHMLDEVNNRPKHCNMIVLEVPRGFAKSMLVSTLNPLHKCVFGGIKFVVVSSYSGDRANLIIGDFKNIIKGEHFQKWFRGTVLVREREDLIEVENKELGFHFWVMGRGRGSQIAGMRVEETRPQIFIGDDLEDPEESYNQSIVDKNEAFVNGVVQYGLDNEVGYSILVGTPFAFDCTTQRFTRKYPEGVRTIMYPGIVSDVAPMGNRKGMTAEEMSAKLGVPVGHSIWEDKFSTESLLKKRDDSVKNGTIEHFMRNIMLDPRSEGTVRIPVEKMHRIPLDKLDEVKKMKLNVYILADYAYSRQVWADESAYVVIGIDDDSNHYILASDCGKWGDIGTTTKIIEKVNEYKSQLKFVGVEARGMGYIEKSINEIKRANNLSFAFEELKPKNRSKAERIKSTISMFDNGQVYIVDGQRKIESQMMVFRGEEMKHGDDLIDTWAYIRDVGVKPITAKTAEEELRLKTHIFFERWANSQPDYVKKQNERTMNRRVYHAGMRPNYF